MSHWILDTNTVSLLLHGHPEVRRHIGLRSPSELSITIVNVEEMLGGWYSQIRRAKTDSKILLAYRSLYESLSFIRQVNVIEFDSACLDQVRNLKALRLQIGTNDLRIAAIALVRDAKIVTQNTGDFERIPGLAIEDWTV